MNIERIRADFTDHTIDYLFCNPDFDDECVITIDDNITNIYDYQSDLLSEDFDDYRYLYEEITRHLKQSNSSNEIK